MEKEKWLKAVKIVLPLIIAVISFTVLYQASSTGELNNKTIRTLQEKQETVLKLSAASTGIAAGASLVLGDRAAAVSNKLLDLTGYFVIILSAILLEKYLVAAMGLISFKILIPISCIIFSIFTFVDKGQIRKFAIKLFSFAIISFLVIPTSIMVSNAIEKSYGGVLNATIDTSETIISDFDIINEIEEGTTQAEIEEKSKNWFESAKDKMAETLKGAVSKVTEKAKEIVDRLTKELNNMIDSIAIMIVTTCVIPILVILFFLWLVKLLFRIDINLNIKSMPKLSEYSK